jgi:hypothetical protein
MSTTNMVSLEISATKTAFEVPMSDRLRRRNVIDLTDWLPVFRMPEQRASSNSDGS